MSDGRHELICPQGHVFEVPSGDSVGEAVSCPECGEVLSDTEAGTASLHPDRPRRGLWDMMQKPHADESTASGQESEASAPADDPAATDDPVAADDRPRGLWALMSGQEEASNSTEVDGDPEINSAFDEPETNEARGDSGFLYGSESTDESDGEEFEEEDSYDDGLVEDDVVNDGWGIEDAETDAPATSPGSDESTDSLEARSGNTRRRHRAFIALTLGFIAVLLSGLNVLPWLWTKIPSIVAGIATLVVGYQAASRRKRGARFEIPQVIAGVGMLLGLTGIFAGPLVLNSLGEHWRQDRLHRGVEENLSRLGEALDLYHDRHGRYPPAGTFRIDGDDEVPLHGWMTALLPHLGETSLSESIDQTKTYDDTVNEAAMKQVVHVFLVPHVEHEPTGRGLAVTHFSGVGGQTTTERGRAHLGIFDRNQVATRHDITDGLSQTMIAGEISRAYPAWGEPGNWRSIGRGLNRQVSGFGNANGDGAHFLMADGSVRFFTNSTANSVLNRLSTRDGGDHVPDGSPEN